MKTQNFIRTDIAEVTCNLIYGRVLLAQRESSSNHWQKDTKHWKDKSVSHQKFIGRSDNFRPIRSDHGVSNRTVNHVAGLNECCLQGKEVTWLCVFQNRPRSWALVWQARNYLSAESTSLSTRLLPKIYFVARYT